MLQRFKRWFAKLRGSNSSTVQLGIAFQKNSLSVVVRDSETGSIRSLFQDVVDEQYSKALVEALALLEVSSGRCQLVLSAEQYQIVQIERPSVNDDEMEQALPWSVKDLISFKVEDLIVDYVDVMSPANMQQVKKINVICASREFLSSIVSTLDGLNIEIEGICTEEYAVQKMVHNDDDAVLLVSQQNEQEINLQIIKSGEVYFSRRLRGYAQLPQQTAEQLQFGMADNLILELQRSSDYFESQLRQAPIRNVLLSLPTDHFGVFDAAISQSLSFKVSEFQVDEIDATNVVHRVSMNVAYAALLTMTEPTEEAA